MQAIHITHSAPFFAKASNKGRTYEIADFELLTTIFSALKWRELNGDIRLYTDSIAREYYKDKNMLELWNSGINTKVLDNIREEIDFEIFWAAGKIYALQNEKTPCIMMDTDFISWTNISQFINEESKIICIHREEIADDVYLPHYLLKTAPGYEFNPEWDWNEKPCNTAFVYFADEDIKHFYTNEAIRFMENNLERPRELVSQMVFAEQRLLAMCAGLKKVKIDSFVKQEELFTQNSFTHIWGYKRELEQESIKEYTFCQQVVELLLNNFNESRTMLLDIPVVQKYL